MKLGVWSWELGSDPIGSSHFRSQLPTSNPQLLRHGQGLLETTIAIGVIVTGLFAVFTLVLANTRSSDRSAQRFVATQFAREGIEVVRSLRDANGLAGVAWDTGIASTGADTTAIPVFDLAAGTWSLQYAPEEITSLGARIIRVEDDERNGFSQDPSGGIGAGETPYRRLLTLDPICSDGKQETIRVNTAICGADTRIGYRVRSRVEWSNRGATHHVDLETMLYDWR